MEFWQRPVFCACAAALGVALAGCDPAGQSAADDEKEPHFALGQNRVNAMDFPGAVAAFEESLEASPHSAAAHFQLAMLYAEKESNPAAAIYHYQQYLRFNPKAGNAEVVRQQIYTCKQRLAADVLLLPSSPAAQIQLQQLAETNRVLKTELEKWRAYATQLSAAKTNLPPTQAVTETQPAANTAPPTAAAKPSAAKPRTHTVAARETLAAIARKYNVNLDAILAANPSLNPKKLRVGQVINLPPA